MSVSVGDRIPQVDVRVMRDGRSAAIPVSDVIGHGRVVLFAVPGAFTPGCSNQHLPGFVNRAAELAAAGVDVVACISVNDAYVMDAWAKSQGITDEVVMLADGAADFTRAIGMAYDGDAIGLGIRSQRYAMVIEDGVVTAVLPEENGLSVGASTAECVLESLAS